MEKYVVVLNVRRRGAIGAFYPMAYCVVGPEGMPDFVVQDGVVASADYGPLFDAWYAEYGEEFEPNGTVSIVAQLEEQP